MPREGHDHVGRLGRRKGLAISIHVPREGHDSALLRALRSSRSFQSTCPARGTTIICVIIYVSGGISIHVPREGHDV